MYLDIDNEFDSLQLSMYLDIDNEWTPFNFLCI